ncbi:MAG: hypothetical protein AAGM27_12315 [Cyanobacteria bacterium J06554_3]
MRSANGLLGIYENAASAIFLQRVFALTLVMPLGLYAPVLTGQVSPKRTQLPGFNLKSMILSFSYSDDKP